MNSSEPKEVRIDSVEVLEFNHDDSIDNAIAKLIDIKMVFQQKYPSLTRIVVDNYDYSYPTLQAYRFETPEEVTERLKKAQEAQEKDLKQKRIEYEKLKQFFEKEPN